MIPEGSGSFEVPFARSHGTVRIRVASYRPHDIGSDALILIVLHGVARNADAYRDAWTADARRFGALLLAPEFSPATFPTPREFEVGGMRDADRRPLERRFWTYRAVEAIYEAARAAAVPLATGYRLYGHSAGAQFVHRMVSFMPEARIEAAVAANAGCYTMPTPDERFPYGLGEMAPEADLVAAFGRPLTILLGERDDDPDHRQLLRSPEAMRQGPHRLARGLTYFRAARETAAAMGTPFGWDLVTVPDVGHSNGKLAPHAARILLDGGVRP